MLNIKKPPHEAFSAFLTLKHNFSTYLYVRISCSKIEVAHEPQRDFVKIRRKLLLTRTEIHFRKSIENRICVIKLAEQLITL